MLVGQILNLSDFCLYFFEILINYKKKKKKKNKKKAEKFSVEDGSRPGRPKTTVTKANIAAVKIVVKQDARLSVKDIASCTGISEGSVQTILKNVWTGDRFALGGYLICSLRSKRHALNVPGNF